MMESAASSDKKKGNATGFSGLSTLVSDVETSLDYGDSAPDVTQLVSDTPGPKPTSGLAHETSASTGSTPQPIVENNGDSSKVTTGKWLIGIGLAIGVLLIVFVNSTRNEPIHSTKVSVSQAPTTAVPDYSSPPAALVMQGRLPAQDAFSQRGAIAESVDVLDQQVVFMNPSGYCTLGRSAREVGLMDLARRTLGEGSRLVHVAVRCSELEDYKKGQRDMLDHWLQIQLIGSKGNFQRIEMMREAFLAGLSKASPRVNPEEISRRLKASFEKIEISLSQMKFEPIGRDGNAVYFSMRMTLSTGGARRSITGISGITLLNSLPLSINVYEGTGSPQSRGQLQAVQQELLNSLLTENR
jgi:hypothetical protein